MAFDEKGTQTFGPEEQSTATVAAIRFETTGTEIELQQAPRRWVLGSNESCDIVISDPFVSSMHCTLERKPNGAVLVRDRNSRNGTLVDRNLVEAAELRVGSTLRVGKTRLIAVGGRSRGGGEPSALESLRGHDPGFRRTVEQALRAAVTDCNVLIVGETGTGKDLIARAIHEGSRRARGNFVAVNCGGIPRELIASELFGHVKGAFTGATNDRDGYFVEAHGGTLFLDELGELPMEMQPNLLRVLETRHVRRVGGHEERAVDVRIVAATNRLDGLGTDNARLRLDLYHRLATVVLVLPPLRDRMGDMMELVKGMLEDLAPEQGKKTITAEAWRALASYSWPGNVRELRHAVARAVALGGVELGPLDFFPDMRLGRHTPFAQLPTTDNLAPYHQMLRGSMEQALLQHGSIRAAAAALGMAKSTFADKAKAWGLTPRPRAKVSASAVKQTAPLPKLVPNLASAGPATDESREPPPLPGQPPDDDES